MQLMAVALMLHAPQARSASICGWADESDQTHLSDVVPTEYQQSADSLPPEATRESTSHRLNNNKELSDVPPTSNKGSAKR